MDSNNLRNDARLGIGFDMVAYVSHSLQDQRRSATANGKKSVAVGSEAPDQHGASASQRDIITDTSVGWPRLSLETAPPYDRQKPIVFISCYRLCLIQRTAHET